MAEQKDQEIENLKQEINRLKSQMVTPSETQDSQPKEEEDKTQATIVRYKWTVPSRIFRKRDNRWFVSVAFVILVFILLFAFLQDILPIFVLVALMFLVYLLGTVEPQDVTHEITNKGVYTAEKLHKWEELENFWFAKQNDWLKLYVDTNLQFPSRLIMLVKPEQDKAIFNVLKKDLEYLVMESQSAMSKLTDGEYIPLEKYLPKEEQHSSDTETVSTQQPQKITHNSNVQ